MTTKWSVWLDPGETTGCAFWQHGSMTITARELDFLTLGTWLTLVLSPAVAVGYEDFTIRPGSGRFSQDGSSLQVIGMVRWLTHSHNAVMIPKSQPADRSLGMKHIKRAGWHTPGKGHANDAAAHLLGWAMTTGALKPWWLYGHDDWQLVE